MPIYIGRVAFGDPALENVFRKVQANTLWGGFGSYGSLLYYSRGRKNQSKVSLKMSGELVA